MTPKALQCCIILTYNWGKGARSIMLDNYLYDDTFYHFVGFKKTKI